MAKKSSTAPKWVPVFGKWSFDSNTPVYLGPDESLGRPAGIALSSIPFRSGKAKMRVAIGRQDNEETAARFILGYNAATRNYYSVGIGGYGNAYVIDAFTESVGWRRIEGAGLRMHIAP